MVAPPLAPVASAPPLPPAAPPPPAPGPVYGVPVYAVPAPQGTALVVPPEVLDGLRDAGYVLATAPAAVRVDLLVAEGSAGAAAGTIEPLEVETVLRRAVSAATLAPDAAARRLAAVGPHGAWYAVLLIWGWLLLLFAALNAAQVLGGLWLVAGLPLARRAFRNRTLAWGRRGAAGWHLLAEPPQVRPLPHAGLTELARVVAGLPDDPPGACRAAAQACPGAGLSGLAPFYAALAAGQTPPGVYAWVTPAPDQAAAPPEPAAEASPAEAVVGAADAGAAAAGPAEPAGPAGRAEDVATEAPGGAPPAGTATEATEGEPPRTSSTPS